jgi:hypothetical protein
LSPGHSDITRFRPRSPVATGNHLDRAYLLTHSMEQSPS